jgi:transcriptional regulator with XRE-family HTH domain
MPTKSVDEQFGQLLQERREQVKMDRAALANLLDVRVETIEGWEQDGQAADLTLARLEQIADALGTTAANLTPAPDGDLDGGVRIQYPEEQSVLTGVRGGVDYYTYHCLVKTRTLPSLVPLVVDVLVDDPAKAQLNHGHAGNEFIYVLEGEIDMKWGDPEKPNQAVLPAGSSLYLKPYVRHSFTATPGAGTTRLLAVNF